MNFIPEIERLLSGERNKFSELFGLVDGLMLTGSYATKSSTRNSDIDIIVLSRNVNYLYTARKKPVNTWGWISTNSIAENVYF